MRFQRPVETNEMEIRYVSHPAQRCHKGTIEVCQLRSVTDTALENRVDEEIAYDPVRRRMNSANENKRRKLESLNLTMRTSQLRSRSTTAAAVRQMLGLIERYTRQTREITRYGCRNTN